jgi:hypothetical protein
MASTSNKGLFSGCVLVALGHGVVAMIHCMQQTDSVMLSERDGVVCAPKISSCMRCSLIADALL